MNIFLFYIFVFRNAICEILCNKRKSIFFWQVIFKNTSIVIYYFSLIVPVNTKYEANSGGNTWDKWDHIFSHLVVTVKCSCIWILIHIFALSMWIKVCTYMYVYTHNPKIQQKFACKMPFPFWMLIFNF